MQDNVYVYFRSNDKKIVMVVMNGNTAEKMVDTRRFASILGEGKKGTNVLTKEEVQDLTTLKVERESVVIIEIGR